MNFCACSGCYGNVMKLSCLKQQKHIFAHKFAVWARLGGGDNLPFVHWGFSRQDGVGGWISKVQGRLRLMLRQLELWLGHLSVPVHVAGLPHHIVAGFQGLAS